MRVYVPGVAEKAARLSLVARVENRSPFVTSKQRQCTDIPGTSDAEGQKRRRSRLVSFDVHPGVPRIVRTALSVYAAVGFPDDSGEQRLAMKIVQPVHWDLRRVPPSLVSPPLSPLRLVAHVVLVQGVLRQSMTNISSVLKRSDNKVGPVGVTRIMS